MRRSKGPSPDPAGSATLPHGLSKSKIAIVAACAALAVVVVVTTVAVALGGLPVGLRAAIPSPTAGLPDAQDTDAPASPIAVQPSPVTGPLVITGDPNALPGFLLVSDRGNSRVIELDPRGNIVWQFPPAGYHGAVPFDQNDDAFYSPDRRYVTTNEEFEHTVQVIDRLANRVTWWYGTPYHFGSGPNLLNSPDDAYMLPDGRVMAADIKNCRIVLISSGGQTSQLGHTGVCRHDPVHGYFASPNGDAPSADFQHVVVTEIGGNWVDVFTFPGLQFEYTFHSPAHYSSDAIMQPDGTFILSDYVAPGAVYRVDRTGRVLWKYDRNLDHPSIAIGLPNGYVAMNDDYGDRLIIVDPVTNTIKWQYGQKNSPGRTAGHLYIPDGLDFRPPGPLITPSPKPGNL
jgi:hypothetical protein